MTDEKKKVDVKETADSIIRETKAKSNNSQFVLWFAALILGAVLRLDGHSGAERIL